MKGFVTHRDQISHKTLTTNLSHENPLVTWQPPAAAFFKYVSKHQSISIPTIQAGLAWLLSRPDDAKARFTIWGLSGHLYLSEFSNIYFPKFSAHDWSFKCHHSEPNEKSLKPTRQCTTKSFVPRKNIYILYWKMSIFFVVYKNNNSHSSI